MLCEVGYFFCGRTDSYFEENAKDGTISGRNHLRKELVMKVESSSYEAYLAAMEEWKQKMQETQATQQKEENSATDSILMKLDELGLSLEDLSDEDNLASLATAMNEGAANIGLPTIEDLDSAVSTLHEKLSANWSSYFEVEEA